VALLYSYWRLKMVRFVVLAFGITWLLVTPLVLAKAGVGPALPSWLHGLGALGPLLAAYWSPRTHGLFETRDRSVMTSSWITVSLLTPVFFAVIALAVVAASGTLVVGPLWRAASQPAWWLDLAVGSCLYGIGEELGWRGWLLPRLEQRHTAVAATLLLAPMWAAWHAPFFFYRFDFGGFGTVVGFFVGLLAGAFWLTFLYNSTGRSVKVVAGWHVIWNVSNIALAAVSATTVAILNALMMVLGFGVAIVFGRQGLRLREHPGANESEP
jgi:membrane protease YdiL (CAAX protease family)